MARWTASAKWGAAPALDGQRDMPSALRLSEGLGRILVKVIAVNLWNLHYSSRHTDTVVDH